MWKGFRQFLLRGNLLELAVAVVIGTAFGAMISALVRDLMTPLIAAIGGNPNFSSLAFTVNSSRFLYGDFLNSVLSFVMVSAAVYFVVVAPVARITARSNARKLPATRPCPDCLSVIPSQARRCAHCTSEVTPVKTLKTGS
jgi:large conductance mechanosensitive channel